MCTILVGVMSFVATSGERANASPTAVVVAANAVASASVGHFGGGYWTYVQRWVPPAFDYVPVYGPCGRIIRWDTICVRLGYWYTESVWVPCYCRG
jgi:hypothetical protein